jgi:hypothetical protein
MLSVRNVGRVGLAVMSGLFVAATPAQAIGLQMTIPTAALDAESTFTFSSGVTTLMNRLSIDVNALGNAKALGGSTLAFSMPVTEVTASVGLLPPSITPVSGKAMGSALGFLSESGGFALGNFSLDFNRNVLQADFISASGTSKAMDVFNFHVAEGLRISMNGGLSMNMKLDQMTMTGGASTLFANALGVGEFATVLPQLDFGTLSFDIAPSLRSMVSTRPYAVVTAVPEAPGVTMLGLGMLGMAAVSRRKSSH